jgi:hypothetical protein
MRAIFKSFGTPLICRQLALAVGVVWHEIAGCGYQFVLIALLVLITFSARSENWDSIHPSRIGFDQKKTTWPECPSCHKASPCVMGMAKYVRINNCITPNAINFIIDH